MRCELWEALEIRDIMNRSQTDYCVVSCGYLNTAEKDVKFLIEFLEKYASIIASITAKEIKNDLQRRDPIV